MNTAELKREAITLPCDGDLRVELGRKAEALLGYSVLRKDARVPGELGKILHALGIEPYSDESVKKYKAAKLAAWQKANPDGTTADGSALSFELALQQAQMQRQMLGMQNSASLFGFGGLGAAASLASAMTIKVASWSSTALRGYGKPVPEFAIQRAVTIKTECPGAEFFVEEMKEETRTLDPFLVVAFQDERFYVDVWDEPEFERLSETAATL